MSSPSSWGRSPIVAGTSAAAAVQASLTLPATSSHLSVLQTKKINRLRIRSSYGCPPEKNPPNSEPLAWSEKGSKTLPLSIPKSGDFVSVIRKLSSDLGIKYFRKRPLWKRIFFASKKVRSLILLNVLTVIYASDIPVLKEVEDVMDPAVFTAVRFLLTAIPFLPFIFQTHGDWKTRSCGLELGIWVSLGFLCQSLGLLTSDAGHASFISAITVIVVPMIDGLAGAKVPAITWYGALLSLMGVAMLECCGSSVCVGDALNLMSAIFFGIHTLRTEHISRSTNKDKFLALLGYQVSVVALSSVIWVFLKSIFDDNQFGFGSSALLMSWDWAISFPWIPAIYTGIFSTGLCLWAEMAAMCDVSATETAIIYGLEPVWGGAFAWFLLGERWGTIEWIGAALVLCGNLTVQILGSTQEKSKKDDERSDYNHLLSATDKRNDLALSTVVINTRKNTSNYFIGAAEKHSQATWSVHPELTTRREIKNTRGS
ncbi:Multidrug resistance efflux transporter EmrE domain-containing protein [Dioscorea alata]|uniref:Multidrug resistance efflux transporter EmrE domain-containing protein n=1 Tax=Dioscorea alata TaxID=55571 RepID=A0ACB7U383_DIOAL|nr:Multidrug resistance efflux transporter EmrE domain-containing protein [Dioscorea alata]